MPASGRSSPERMRSRVDLPEPFSPTMPTSVPEGDREADASQHPVAPKRLVEVLRL